MPPLEFVTYNPENERWSKKGAVKPGEIHTLFNFRPEDRKQEMIILESGDAASTIRTAELGKGSFVQPGRMQVIGELGPPKEVARLEKGESFEMTIKEYEYSLPIRYRFSHK